MASKTKTCSRCGLEKPPGEFYRQAGGAQGRRGRCEESYRAAERASWARDPKVQPLTGTCPEELDQVLFAQYRRLGLGNVRAHFRHGGPLDLVLVLTPKQSSSSELDSDCEGGGAVTLEKGNHEPFEVLGIDVLNAGIGIEPF